MGITVIIRIQNRIQIILVKQMNDNNKWEQTNSKWITMYMNYLKPECTIGNSNDYHYNQFKNDKYGRNKPNNGC